MDDKHCGSLGHLEQGHVTGGNPLSSEVVRSCDLCEHDVVKVVPLQGSSCYTSGCPRKMRWLFYSPKPSFLPCNCSISGQSTALVAQPLSAPLTWAHYAQERVILLISWRGLLFLPYLSSLPLLTAKMASRIWGFP